MSVAQYFAENLSAELISIEQLAGDVPERVHTAVVVFPVYCEMLPKPVKFFFAKLEAKYVALIATYGKICPGNVLQDAQKQIKGQVIAGAYIPTGHIYLREDASFETEKLEGLFNRIRSPHPAIMPRVKRHLWAYFFPKWRSQIGVKIKKNSQCNHCGLCERKCPMQAVHKERIGRKCIRCLRCVSECPQKALEFDLHFALKKYLAKERD